MVLFHFKFLLNPLSLLVIQEAVVLKGSGDSEEGWDVGT